MAAHTSHPVVQTASGASVTLQQEGLGLPLDILTQSFGQANAESFCATQMAQYRHQNFFNAGTVLMLGAAQDWRTPFFR
jgi:hypothetical protein